MTATTSLSPSNLKSASPGSVATPTHQLPPSVHAIGGSIGSALAILVFYPLERVRIELQSRVDDVSSANSRKTGHECNRASSDDVQNINTEQTDDTSCGDMGDQTDHLANDNVTEQSHMGAKAEAPFSTPDSSDGSFEIVPSLKSDVESWDMSDGHLTETNSLNSKEEDGEDQITYIGLVEEAQDSPPARSTSVPNDNLSSARSGANIENESDVVKSPPIQHETIIQCLLRLHNDQTLYKGASHMVTTLMISNAVFFYALQVSRRSLASLQQQDRHHKSKHPLSQYLPKSKLGKSLVASSLAGTINVLLTNPMWVALLRIMESKVPVEVNKQRHQQQPNIWRVMQLIARKEGVSRLWNGTSTSLMLVSNPIIQHFIYEQLRLWLLEKRSGSRHNGRKRPAAKSMSLSPIEAFVFGALAKAIATVVTYPLQLAQVLLRLQKKKLQTPPTSNSNTSSHNNSSNKQTSSDIAYEGTLDCLYQQFVRGGIPGLFQGMNAKLLQTVLTAAFTFLTYEQTLELVGRGYQTLGLMH